MGFSYRRGDAPPEPPFIEGSYHVRIVDVEERVSSSGSLLGLIVKGQIEAPQSARGLYCSSWYSVEDRPPQDPPSKSVAIGLRQIEALCEALGIAGFEHPQEIVGKVGVAKLAKDDYGVKIKGWQAREKLPKPERRAPAAMPEGAPAPPPDDLDDLPF